MKRIFAVLAATLCAAMPMSSRAYEWSGGDATLGDGKVQILCNGSGEVTGVVAKPTGGETLTISGAAMTFAAEATITIASDNGVFAGGKLVFENDVSAAGALSLARTDGAYAVWSDPSSPMASGTWKTVVSGGVTSVADWEIVKVTAKSEDRNPAANYYTGPYSLVSHDDGVTTSGGREYRLFVLNRFWAQYPRTISIRVALGRATSGGDLLASLFTIVRGPENVCLPKTDLWTTWYGNMPSGTGLYGIYDERAKGPNGAEYGGQGGNYCLDRVVVRHVGSEATVGFAGEASISGAVDVGLGVKFSLLPKANSTFAAPVFTGIGDVEYQRNATLANANRMKYATDLTVTNGATVTVTGTGAFPTNGMVNARSGGILVLNVSDSSNVRGISDGLAELHVHTGGEIRVPKDAPCFYNIANGARSCTQEVFVEGGTFWPAYDTEYSANLNWNTAKCYLPFLTISDGGRVRGTHALWGNNYPMRYAVAGDGNASSAVIDSVWGIPYTGNSTFRLVVGDCTGDSTEDLVISGEIPNYPNANSSYQYYTTEKHGDGTVRINDKWAIRGKTTVLGGGLVFGDEGCAFPTGVVSQARTSAEGKRDFELRNGATLGKTAGALDLDTLTVTGGGVLDLGPTATMTFADSHAKTWTGRLVVKGFRYGAIRFGTSDAALTAAQVSCIRTVEGKRLYLTSSGYLAPRGMYMIFK